MCMYVHIAVFDGGNISASRLTSGSKRADEYSSGRNKALGNIHFDRNEKYPI